MHFFNYYSPIILLCCSYVTSLTDNHTSGKILKWPSAEQEAIDEKHDAEILTAVQKSMHEWNTLQSKHQRKKRAIKRVCYEELGCFEDSGPFSYLEMLPSHPEEINTKFYFYSTKNRSDRPLLELSFLNMSSAFESLSTNTTKESSSSGSETTTPFSRSAFTMNDLQGFEELSIRVIVHGFGSACPHVWIYEMKTALMAVENCIVICVDWENGAILPNYVKAATNTRLVGKQLAMLLANLQEHKGLDLARTHIIGFSLGAHVAGFAGAELPGLSRITGLDPAGPLFESQHPKVRLDNTDASFVDVIHSNGENLILGGLGSWQPMGHVDFYPNGGRVQTGCSNLFVGAVTDFIWAQTAEVEGRSLCNHRRAYKFFIDSVAPRCLFPAFPCDSYENFIEGKCFPCRNGDSDADENGSKCGNMGYYANRSTGRGQLYLLTREEEPFCAHQFKLEIFNSFNDLPLRTIGKLEATLEGEGGLNETFLVSEKEDTEFFAGDTVSKIIVPHPALGFPTSLTLQYKSYSGWLSKGLPHWDIDKIVLTDSFGRSHSLCKPLLSLLSGIPESFTLKPGNCELIGEITVSPLEAGEEQTEGPVAQQEFDRLDNRDDDVENVKYKKDIFNLGANFKLDKNQSNEPQSTSEQYGNVPWQPIEGNSLEKEIAESSRSLQDGGASEIFEPVLKSARPVPSKGRNMHTFDEQEVHEPILKPTTPKSTRKPESLSEKFDYESDRSGESEPITVQLFPFRLGELLERAERYARETLLPLISEQAPKLFGFGNEKKDNDRKPRYIPRYEEAYNNSITRNKVRARTTNRNDDLTSISETIPDNNKRNLFELVRVRNPKTEIIAQDRSFTNGVNYYTNQMGDKWFFQNPDATTNNRPIRIELPTYRPAVANSKTQTKSTNFKSPPK